MQRASDEVAFLSELSSQVRLSVDKNEPFGDKSPSAAVRAKTNQRILPHAPVAGHFHLLTLQPVPSNTTAAL